MDFIFDYIAADPILVNIFNIFRGIVIILDIFLLIVVVYSLRKLLKYRAKFVWDPRKWQRYLKKKKIKKDLASPVVSSAWAKVRSKLSDGSADSVRLAVIEADGVVGEVLKRMGLSGETFADRLGHLSSDRYTTLDKLWEAHRTRNNLVHTPDFQISSTKAEEAIAAYESFLREAKAL